jgi:hypothetical protein
MRLRSVHDPSVVAALAATLVQTATEPKRVVETSADNPAASLEVAQR